ncbi:hypothetical protein A3B35_01255 [Candidatus Kaiserbacteria bacterium RIFCSPLOWO2_01_FULL_54_24]|uniref:Pesticidal crystal protein Cry22Aa Ig-like domain-containing protein n=1 Tax=Candidatus Kaiserbacteria bacterium RIFCSPLOWO2_01_FULL_54_24 TaxID=1798515 RepID=A0A1F6EUX0_9BACT|nr:MAG: hypothetical protein A3B35_01255 [Candidatus Kaiserbacteria bacterium RIFCSPLOWO2_01_FULL_54_24]
MGSLLNFVQYHNAVPIAISIALLGAGGVFAATNPEAIYSETQTPVSADNTYLVGKDLSAYSPRAEIVGVTEDEDFYYVAYKLLTIDLMDYVWQDIEREEVMKVSKPDLGPYRDLGLYVMEQLRQIIGSESARLSQTQEMARKNVSQKVVSVAYGGLIGILFDETTETLPGYTPVVQPPPPPVVASASEEPPASNLAAAAAAVPASALGPGVVLSGDPDDTEPPYLQILGSDPVMLKEGDSYLDLGAVAADNGKTENVTLNLYLNGAKQERIYIRSAQVGEWIITYEAVDKAGNIRRVTRKIIVGEAQNSSEQQDTATTTQETQATPNEQDAGASDAASEQSAAPAEETQAAAAASAFTTDPQTSESTANASSTGSETPQPPPAETPASTGTPETATSTSDETS